MAVFVEPFSPDIERMVSLLQEDRQPAVAVIGDYCLDKYLYIDAALDEPSLETGLTAYQVRRKALFPGAAGTVSNNLHALGCKACCFGLCGDDGEGFELRRELRRIEADLDGFFISPDLFTATYTKPMREVDGQWKELNRLDIRTEKLAPEELTEQVLTRLESSIGEIDAVIIADQFTFEAGSFFSCAVRQALSLLAQRNPKKFFLVDSRSHAADYQNILIKCNASEILDVYGRFCHNDRVKAVGADLCADTKEEEILLAGEWLVQRNRSPLLVTRGKEPSFLFDGERVYRIPVFQVTGPLDICGAGDASDAGMAFGRALGLDLPHCAYLAAAVSSITIEQLGVTGTASRDEVIARLRRG